jgi:hypothetical protein
MIIKSFSIPSASCVHSVVREMTADEIRLMNEQIAARRAALVAQVREQNNPLEARLAAIDTALGAGLDMETVNNLLEEKAEILNKLEQE